MTKIARVEKQSKIFYYSLRSLRPALFAGLCGLCVKTVPVLVYIFGSGFAGIGLTGSI